MGQALAGLLILSVLFTGAFMFFRAQTVGSDIVGSSMRESAQLEGERARTEIDIINAGTKSCRTLVINILNEGHTSVSKSEFPKVDIIIHFNGTDDVSQELTYEPGGTASLDKGEWTDLSISGTFETEIWNPGETLKIEAYLHDLMGVPTGTATVSTPNGIIDTHTLAYLPTPPGCDWYFHSEELSVSGTDYYELKEGASADGTATTISAPIAAVQTGRIRPTSNSGKFVFPLTNTAELDAYQWDVTYRVRRDLLDFGFVWNINANDISLSSTNSWQDIDLSSYVPVGTTGAVVEVVNTSTSSSYSGVVRGKEDTRNYMSSSVYEEIEGETHRWQVVKVDSNREIQGYIENTAIDFKLLGYTIGSDPEFIISGNVTPDVTPSFTDSWRTVDVSSYVDADADGVILFVDSIDSSDQNYGIREVGSSDGFTGFELEEYGNTMYMVGINGSDQFQAWIDNTNVKIYLVAQTKGSVGYYTNDVSVSDPSLNSWQEIDADTYSVPDAAKGVVLHATNTENDGCCDQRIGFRHGDSTDSWHPGQDIGGDTHFQAAVGIRDSDNVWDEYMQSSGVHVYLAGYTRLIDLDVHVDIDAVIRQADGNIRTTLATNVANTSSITTDVWTTYTVTYSFPGYTVVDSTDYLEIDLFAEATDNNSGETVNVDFRIDDDSIPIADQMRIVEIVP